MDVAEAQRLKALEDENRRLKRLVANLSLNKHALKSVIPKWLGIASLRAKKWAMDFIVDGLAIGRMVRILSVVDACTH